MAPRSRCRPCRHRQRIWPPTPPSALSSTRPRADGCRVVSTAASWPSGRCSVNRCRPAAAAPMPTGWSVGHGEPVTDPGGRAHPPLPDAGQRSPAVDAALPAARRHTLSALVDALSAPAVSTSDRAATVPRRSRSWPISRVSGPGPPSVIAMRALGDPDAFPASDLGARGAPPAARYPLDHRRRSTRLRRRPGDRGGPTPSSTSGRPPITPSTGGRRRRDQPQTMPSKPSTTLDRQKEPHDDHHDHHHHRRQPTRAADPHGRRRIPRRLHMHGQRHAPADRPVSRRDDAWFADITGQLDAYFDGRPHRIPIFPIRLEGTEFQRRRVVAPAATSPTARPSVTASWPAGWATPMPRGRWGWPTGAIPLPSSSPAIGSSAPTATDRLRGWPRSQDMAPRPRGCPPVRPETLEHTAHPSGETACNNPLRW